MNPSQSIIRIPDDSAGRRESPEYKESRIQIHDKKQDHKGYKVNSFFNVHNCTKSERVNKMSIFEGFCGNGRINRRDPW